jgi:hypothetical protein
VTLDRGGFMATFAGRAASNQGLPAPAVVAVPSSVPARIPATPEVQAPPAIAEKERPVTVVLREPIGQEVGDRTIAHNIGGGFGASY